MFREEIMKHARHASKLVQAHPEIRNSEAQTKNSLIEPFFRCLGYDPSRLEQVTLEVSTELGGKIDYVLTGQADVKIAVEAKKAGVKLSEKETNQLRSYFTFSEAAAALLTNGVDYWFFTDLDKTNVMDATPYHRVDVRYLTANDILHLETLARSQVQQNGVHNQARRERYRRLVNEIVTQELRSPSQEFLRLVGKKVGISPLRKSHLELLAPLVGEAIHRNLGSSSPPIPPGPPPTPTVPPPTVPTSPPQTSSSPLASLFDNPLSAKTYRQVLIDVVIEMQLRHANTFAETVSKEPFVKPKNAWKWISKNREDLSPALENRRVGDYYLDVNLSAQGSVSRARSFLKAFGHNPADLVVHKALGPPKIKGAELFGKPIPAKTYIQMLTSVVSVLQTRHPNDFADRVKDPNTFRGTKRWIISKNRDDLGTAKTKRLVGDYWVYAGGTGRIPRAHRFLKAFGYSPEELVVHTSDNQ